MDPMIVDLLKAFAPFIAAVVATVGAAARWVAARADSAEARAQARYDALLAELRDASAKREAYHASESARVREDAKALGEALALVRSSLERSTAILESIEPRVGGGASQRDSIPRESDIDLGAGRKRSR
jgi:hypothetical protein